MKRTELEALAKKLVEYVEKNPNKTRVEIDLAVSPERTTHSAWETIKHLFDYDRHAARHVTGVTYKRNKIAYGRERVKRWYKSDPKPSNGIIELSKKMQALVDESKGITGTEIREVMLLDMVTFKRASKLIKADRRRSAIRGQGRGMDYYPIGFKMPEPVKKAEELPDKRETPAKVNQYRFMTIAKTDLPILTQWSPLGVVPWLDARA